MPATATLALVYFSGTGHTHLLAEAIAASARAVPGVAVDSHRIAGEEIAHGRFTNEALLTRLHAADTIVFGSPTYMGGPAAQFKAFADATGGVWFKQGWKDKLAGGFTHSSSPSGDKLSTLQYFAVLAAQHGMHYLVSGDLPGVVTPTPDVNRFGFSLGAAGQTPIDFARKEPLVHPGDLETARRYGQRLAEATLRWKRGA